MSPTYKRAALNMDQINKIVKKANSIEAKRMAKASPIFSDDDLEALKQAIRDCMPVVLLSNGRAFNITYKARDHIYIQPVKGFSPVVYMPRKQILEADEL